MLAHPGEGGGRRFLHHVAELPGQGQPGVSLHSGRLGEEEVSSHRRPGEPHGHPRHADPLHEFARERGGGAQQFADDLRSDLERSLLALGELADRLAADLRDGPLHVAEPGLPRVFPDDQRERFAVEDRLVLLVVETVVFELARNEVPGRDLDLLLLGVPLQVEDLHPVLERGRNRIHHVRGGDEQHVRQVEREVQVVVPEGVVLLGIEDLEERRTGIAPEVHPELVHLVQHEDGIPGAGPHQTLDDLAGQRSDVGAAMSSDLGLVANAAQAEADELAADGLGDRPAEARLADARRPREAEDGSLLVGLSLPHREELEDPVLDLLEVVVVRFEDVLGPRDVVLVLGPLVPGDPDQPVEVGPPHGVLRGGGRNPAEPPELPQGFLLGLLGHPGLLDLLPEFVHLLGGVVALAELLLDRLHLLAQEELPLGAAHFALDLGLDAPPEIADLLLPQDRRVGEPQPVLDGQRLEDLLTHLGIQARQLLRDEVRQLTGAPHPGELRLHDLPGAGEEIRLDHLLEFFADLPGQRFELHGLVGAHRPVQDADVGAHVRLGLHDPLDPEPEAAPNHDPDGPLAHPDLLFEPGGGADPIEIVLAGMVHRIVLLGEDREHHLAGSRRIGLGGLAGRVAQHLDGALAADGERQEGVREDHDVPERQHGHHAVHLALRRA